MRQPFDRGIGSDFIYSMPWDEIDSVLEIGAGFGSGTMPLSERARNIVTVEAASDLTFSPESFDLIAIDDSAAEIQPHFLARILRLLRPNGYLYIARQRQLGLRSIHGFRDLLRFVTHRWSVPQTPAQFARLIENAGFGKVEIFGVHGSFDRHIAVYRLGDTRPRQVTLSIVNPAATWKRKLYCQMLNAMSWRPARESAMVVFARKKPPSERLFWSGLPCGGPITQFSTANKVFALCFTNDRPTSICVAAKTPHARERLPREYDFLKEASERHGPESQSWLLRWPRTLGKFSVHGQEIYHYEYADGTPLNRLLLPVSFDQQRFLRLFARLMSEYLHLCRKLTAGLSDRISRNGAERSLISRLGEVTLNDDALRRRIREACSRLEQRPGTLHVTHGDLSLCNTVVLADDTLVLIDWENINLAGLIEIDLMRLLYDTWDESARLRPKARQALMEKAKHTTRETLSTLGIAPCRYSDVETLFLAHQLELGEVRHVDPCLLLKAYEERAFALD